MVSQRTQPVSEPFTLEQIDTTLIPSGNRSDGTANAWTAIWKFQVPAGQGMVLSREDMLAFYLEDASAEVGNNDCLVRISVRDTAESDSRVIYGPRNYVTVKEFQDRRKVARLGIPVPVKVYEEQWIVIEVKDNGAIDESDSQFMLEMPRTRQGLG